MQFATPRSQILRSPFGVFRVAIYFEIIRIILVTTKAVELHAEQLSALGHPARLAILRFVVQGDPNGTPAGEIQAHVDLPASTLSHHLKRLSSVSLLVARTEGTFIYYRADYDVLRKLTNYLWEDCCKRGAKAGKSCC